MDRADRILLGLSYLFRGSLLVGCVLAFLDEKWINLFSTVLILSLTFLPALISKNYTVSLPIEFDLIIVVFVFASLYLGEFQAFYWRFVWWDAVLHGTSALIFGFIGFLIVYILNHEERLELHLIPRFVAIFSFAFALSIGVLWEIFEYGMDSFFHFNMQKSGLQDTMGDLIIDALGALIASLLGYLYCKKGDSFFFNRLIRKFVKENPKIFGTGKKRT